MLWPRRLKSILLRGVVPTLFNTIPPHSLLLIHLFRFNSGVLVFDPSKSLCVAAFLRIRSQMILS